MYHVNRKSPQEMNDFFHQLFLVIFDDLVRGVDIGSFIDVVGRLNILHQACLQLLDQSFRPLNILHQTCLQLLHLINAHCFKLV